MSTALVWFRNELRIHDNEALEKAIKKHDRVIPFYCFEDVEFGKTTYGFKKTDSFRAQFLIESVKNLRENLLQKDSNLIVRKGSTISEIAKVCAVENVTVIYTHKGIHQEEIELQQSIEQMGLSINYSFGSTLYHINDLPHSHKETPKIFTHFRKGVESKSNVRELFNAPQKLPELKITSEIGEIPNVLDFGLELKEQDGRAAIKASGGETEALKRLDDYLFKSKELSHYKVKRNGLIGSDFSSKLSLWLWNGCISPRKIYWEVKRYEREVEKNDSTYWLIFELIWRDYFKFISLKHGNAIFKLNGIKEERYKWSFDREKFNKWAEGETGVPFIDANMKELNLTGFMSNRGRQNVASFLVKELGLDWRMGAEYFESKLIDYDVASNYGNWMYIAGVGNDPRDRYFNIISQAKRYDGKAEYIKLWLPELRELEANEAHHPWTKTIDLFESATEFPKPMVEPDYWKKHY